MQQNDELINTTMNMLTDSLRISGRLNIHELRELKDITHGYFNTDEIIQMMHDIPNELRIDIQNRYNNLIRVLEKEIDTLSLYNTIFPILGIGLIIVAIYLIIKYKMTIMFF